MGRVSHDITTQLATVGVGRGGYVIILPYSGAKWVSHFDKCKCKLNVYQELKQIFSDVMSCFACFTIDY